MTFDKPEHKELILDMINKVNVPGQLVELFYELKQAVIRGDVTPSTVEIDAETLQCQ